MADYSIDTNSLVPAWIDDYPIKDFPGFCKALERVIASGNVQKRMAEVIRALRSRIGACRCASRL